jgi:site-specific recombinase XerD
MPPHWPIGQCRVCLGWGEKPQYADCGACSSWRQLHPDQAPCRRCGHDNHLNTDGLCRLCLLTIRLEDPEWVAHPVAGRHAQLMLILPGDRLPRSQPLDRPVQGRTPDRTRPRSLLDQLRIATAEPVDDPRVCPPTIPGQLLLVRPRRQLTDTHARRIKHRDLADYEWLKDTAIALATERGLSKAWWRSTCLMLRLALAVREADGGETIPEETLDDLPRLRNAVADVLRHAGLTSARLLAPRRRSRPVVLHKPQRSCQYCDCWGFRRTCPGCSPWKHQRHLHPVGDCGRCGRPDVPLWDGICRACCLHIDQHGPEARTESWTQLWVGGDLAPRLAMRTGALGYVAPHQKARARAAARRPPPPPVSPHLIDPGQSVLFDARRDWSCFAKGTLDQMPSLTPNAQALLADYRQHAAERGLDEQVNRIAARSLRILLAWLGADTPIPEADIWSLPADRPGTSARHILAFLQQRGLVTPDPDRQIHIHQRAIEQRIAELPPGIADELRTWVRVLRGEGRREHRAMSFETIRKYLGYLTPVLTLWTERINSLREITRDDVHAVLKQRPGQPGLDLASALRSLFQALKQERLIFRDPTRGITMTAVIRLPVPIPTDRLRGLIDRADATMSKLVIALVAIHGLGRNETTALLLADLDLQNGTLLVRRELARHTVYLDELTHTLAIAWLRERRRRWPRTINPHLLVSQQTAVMDTAVSAMVMNEIFRPLGLSPSKLRQDRILDEAKHTADPVHLMRVFGISAGTAMKYVYTAHPERRSTLPR